MQNQQQHMAQMAQLNAGGPVGVNGTPVMTNGQRRPPQNMIEPRDQLNTYIYDYFMRNDQPRVARMMIECDLKMSLNNPPQKTSPSGRNNTNGVDPSDPNSKDMLPTAKVPSGQMSDNSFLADWWEQFWDIYSASRGSSTKGTQYTSHVRNMTHLTNEARGQRMMMANGMNGMTPQQQQQYMMRTMQNGVPNDLKRAAAINNRNPNQQAVMANMNQIQKQQAMMGTQMQRDGSQMDMNGRPQSPGSNDNAPSPKRPRVEGGMNSGNAPNQFNEFANVQQQKSIEVYAQSLAQQQRMALNNHAISQGMNAGHQGSPMTQPTSLEGSDSIYAGNQPRSAINAGQAGPPQGNHALQDYQMQLMLLEQQNKKRLLMARQEQDGMPGPQGGPGGFSQAMSPQGSRAGPSPNPTDQQLKKNNTPRMGSTMLPGSPMPDGMMPGQRNSPAPNMSYDSNAPPQAFQQPYPGLPGQMPTTPMMRPNPSSHPNFNPQQMQNLTPQQMDMMRQSNNWRGPQGQPGMMPQQMGPMGNQLQQRGQGQMPPPPAPAGEPPRPQVPSPQQPTQAPPTPNQTNKAGPKSKKATKDNIKKPGNKKGGNAGATPAASGAEEPPTPTTPMHNKNFAQNGQQQQQAQAPTLPQAPASSQQQQQQQQPPPLNNGEPPFGNINGLNDTDLNDFDMTFPNDTNPLDTFDFESFLHVGNDENGFNIDFPPFEGGEVEI